MDWLVRLTVTVTEEPEDEASPLPGGCDHGAVRRGDRVRRVGGPWTPAVHHLLAHLARSGFTGAPRPIRSGTDGAGGWEEVTYLPGETVGDRRPWPAWTHSDQALQQTAEWLSAYHRVVSGYRPPPDAQWRENHARPGPGVVIAHNDAAPYNAVWNSSGLVGFVDWDMAGPRHVDDDLAWTAFSWVPLHARHVVAAEGFTEVDRRRERLAAFLRWYGSALAPDQVLARLSAMIEAQVEQLRQRAAGGDDTYRRMLLLGRDADLLAARAELGQV
jgi:aminoglycoside phosphotransferase (APT) family kinase protein